MRRWACSLCVVAVVGCGRDRDQHAAAPTAPTSGPAQSGAPAASRESRDLEGARQSGSRAVADFYASVGAKRFEEAWSRLSQERRASLGGLQRWKAGYAFTTAIEIEETTAQASDARHAQVRVHLRSTDRDVCGRVVHQRFAGTLAISRSAARWVITDARVAKTGGGTVHTEPGSCATAPDDSESPQAAAPGTASPTTRPTAGSNPHTGGRTKFCYPAIDIPAVNIPATTIAAVDIPAVDVGDRHLPAQHLPAQHLKAQHLPAQHLAGDCLDVDEDFAPQNTTVLDNDYDQLDSGYSSSLTSRYWTAAGAGARYPDPTATGFGQYNAAGFPKNQYVRAYVRKDGTMVHGYWRNSPTDGLPTCRVISC